MRATTSILRNTAYLQVLESISQLKCYLGPGTEQKTATKRRGKRQDYCPRRELVQALVSLDSAVLLASVEAGGAGVSFIPSFKARYPSPSPLPSSGNFLGPKISRAMAKMMIRCHGWNKPSTGNLLRKRCKTSSYIRYRRGRGKSNHASANPAYYFRDLTFGSPRALEWNVRIGPKTLSRAGISATSKPNRHRRVE